MLYYDRIDVSEGTDVNKTSASKECISISIFVTIGIFLNDGLKFQTYACNDLLMPMMNHSNIAISKIKNADYCCIVSGISKSKAIKLLQNTDLTEKSGTL